MQKELNSLSETARFPVLTDAILTGPLLSKSMSTLTAKIFLVVVGSVLLAISAQLKIPLYPVPITGQTLIVLLIGMTYGLRLGGTTIVVYLLQGAVGLQVFAGGSFGISTLIGPTGGYLAGFLLAALVMGFLAERGMGRTIFSTVIAMMVGNAVIYLVGASWLASFVGADKALAAGVLPFLYGDVLKIAVAAGLMPLAWRLVRRLQK